MNRPSMALLLALAASACVAPPPRPAPEPPKVAFSKIGVLPADVQFTQVTFQGDNPRLTSQEASMRERIASSVASAVRSRGFTVLGAQALDEAATSVPDLRFQTTQLQGAFLETLRQMGSAGEDPNVKSLSRRHTVGAQASRVADPIDADALVLCRLTAYEKSGGELAKDFVKAFVFGGLTGPQMPPKFAVLSIALVDGASGDLLWDRMTWSGGDFETTGLDEMVNRALALFPRASTPIVEAEAPKAPTSVGVTGPAIAPAPAVPSPPASAPPAAPTAPITMAAAPVALPPPASLDVSRPAPAAAPRITVATDEESSLGRCQPATVRAMKRDGASEREISGACQATLEETRTFLE